MAKATAATRKSTTKRTTTARNSTSKAKPAKSTPGKSRKPQATTGKPSSPGVIATMVELLTAASAKQPMSKQQLCDELAKRFPERAPEAMMRTIHCQLPSRLKQRFNVKQNDKREFWIV